MDRIINQKIDFYREITTGNKLEVGKNLKKNNIEILEGFIKNSDLVREFYATYYTSKSSRVVLCGINPGQFGAGKTGVPFLDFKSLSTLLPGITTADYERSAQFIYRIIGHFGAEAFFDNVYLTNISWFGFKKGQKNLNYYELTPDMQREFTNGFIEEMNIVKPSIIIPLSDNVEKTLRTLPWKTKIKIGERLAHPNFLSFPSRFDDGVQKYIESIKSYI